MHQQMKGEKFSPSKIKIRNRDGNVRDQIPHVFLPRGGGWGWGGGLGTRLMHDSTLATLRMASLAVEVTSESTAWPQA